MYKINVTTVVSHNEVCSRVWEKVERGLLSTQCHTCVNLKIYTKVATEKEKKGKREKRLFLIL